MKDGGLRGVSRNFSRGVLKYFCMDGIFILKSSSKLKEKFLKREGLTPPSEYPPTVVVIIIYNTSINLTGICKKNGIYKSEMFAEKCELLDHLLSLNLREGERKSVYS